MGNQETSSRLAADETLTKYDTPRPITMTFDRHMYSIPDEIEPTVFEYPAEEDGTQLYIDKPDNICTEVGQIVYAAEYNDAYLVCNDTDILSDDKIYILDQALENAATFFNENINLIYEPKNRGISPNSLLPCGIAGSTPTQTALFYFHEPSDHETAGDIRFVVLTRAFSTTTIASAASLRMGNGPESTLLDSPRAKFNAPNMGLIYINVGKIPVCKSTDKDYESKLDKYTKVIIHEVIHALGFADQEMSCWLLPDTFTGDMKKTVTSYKRSVTILVTPNAVQAYIDHFGANPITSGVPDGIELEDDGGSGTAGAHLETRVYYQELMTGWETDGSYLSHFTRAILLDTGWYSIPVDGGFHQLQFGLEMSKKLAATDPPAIEGFAYKPPYQAWPKYYYYNSDAAGFPSCSSDPRAFGSVGGEHFVTNTAQYPDQLGNDFFGTVPTAVIQSKDGPVEAAGIQRMEHAWFAHPESFCNVSQPANTNLNSSPISSNSFCIPSNVVSRTGTYGYATQSDYTYPICTSFKKHDGKLYMNFDGDYYLCDSPLKPITPKLLQAVNRGKDYVYCPWAIQYIIDELTQLEEKSTDKTIYTMSASDLAAANPPPADPPTNNPQETETPTGDGKAPKPDSFSFSNLGDWWKYFIENYKTYVIVVIAAVAVIILLLIVACICCCGKKKDKGGKGGGKSKSKRRHSYDTSSDSSYSSSYRNHRSQYRSQRSHTSRRTQYRV